MPRWWVNGDIFLKSEEITDDGTKRFKTYKSACESINAVIPNFDDTQFIKANNLVEKSRPSESTSNTDQVKVSDTKSKFFVNTKFHFENNSWTWVHGGQIRPNEWLRIEGTHQIYPVIPIQV